MTTAIELGNNVKCKISGIQGIAVSKFELLSGNVQIGIQPKAAKDAKEIPELQGVDHHLVEVVSAGLASSATKPTAVTDVVLGSEAEDIISGFSGIVIEKATHMNGCVFFVLEKMQKDIDQKSKSELKKLKKDAAPFAVGERAITRTVEIGRIKKIGEGIAKVHATAPVAENGKVPGGFSRKIPKQRG